MNATHDTIATDEGCRALLTRFESLPAPWFADELEISLGTIHDYRALSHFHYRSGRPGAVTNIWRMIRLAPTVVGRFLGRDDETQLVGVLVCSLPALACRLRDIATSRRYVDVSQHDAAVMLNREVRCISRVVIDPRFRGLGLAVRLVRHALEHPESGIVYTEALAAMGRISPLFEHAGMTRYDRPFRSRADHARLLDALERLEISPAMLASRAAIESHPRMADADSRRFLEAELRRWHKAAHRTPKQRLDQMMFDELRIAARDGLISQPVYYLFHHGSKQA